MGLMIGKAVPTHIVGSGAGLRTQGIAWVLTPNQRMNIGVVFNLPLNDLGAGIVNTTPTLSAGSPTATFTRASTAWTKLSTGLWAQIASGQPRSAYIGMNTAVGTYGGYYSEKAGTQLVTPTASIRDMTDAAWTASNITAAKTATGIDGTANSASTLTAGAGNGTILQTLTAAASTRTYSCWIKRRTGTGEIDITQNGGSSWTNVTSQINASTYTQVALQASVLNASFGIRIVTNGDAVDVDFNQFEAGSIATSPMDAAGANRAADMLTYAAAGNINNADGTFYLEMCPVDFGTASLSGGWGYIGDGGNQLLSIVNSLTNLFTFDGTNATNHAVAAMVPSTIYKTGVRWSSAGISVFQAGATAGNANSAFDGDMGVTTLSIGSNAGSANFAMGTVKNVRIYFPSLTDAAVLAMTA